MYHNRMYMHRLCENGASDKKKHYASSAVRVAVVDL